MQTPIIVPLITHTETKCIVQNNKIYCERDDVSSVDLGYVLLFCASLILWIMLWLWISERWFDFSFGVIVGGAIVLPLLIGGIYLIF